MPKVTIRPQDIEIEVPEGATLMAAAEALGYYWPTTCGGEGRCTTCASRIISGMENLSPRGRSEERVLADERGPAVLQQPIRLACQVQVFGDVEVQKPGVRRPFGIESSSLDLAESRE